MFNLAGLVEEKRPDKGQALDLKVGGWAWGKSPHPVKVGLITETLSLCLRTSRTALRDDLIKKTSVQE